VVPQPGVSHVTLAKLTQEKDDPQVDVAWIDGGISDEAEARGLLAHLDPGKVKNIADMVPEGVYKNDKGEIFALGTGFFSLGLVYNTEAVKTPPTSWNDLWDEKYKGQVTLPNAQNTLSFFLAMIENFGGSIDNPGPYIEKLKALDAVAFFDSSGQATNLFESGEVIIGAHYAQAAWTIADKGLPISFVVPVEGAPADDIRIHAVKNGPAGPELAEQFIDYAVSAESATCMANTLYVGPATKGVELSEKARARMPWGPEGSVANLKLQDWSKLNSRRQEFLDIWTNNISQR
jgi:putative spermidine/putrescine transport system substrate-binding protein